MLNKTTIIGAVLFLSLFLAGQAFAGWGRTEVAYWGASGTACCNNSYRPIPIHVGLQYMNQSDALSALWQEAYFVCRYKGGLRYLSQGNAYSRWIPIYNGPWRY